MSKVLDNVKKTDDLEVEVVIVAFDKERGFRVQAKMMRFEATEGQTAKIKKRTTAYHESTNLDDAQNGAIERAASLLGL